MERASEFESAFEEKDPVKEKVHDCLLYTSPSPRDA